VNYTPVCGNWSLSRGQGRGILDQCVQVGVHMLPRHPCSPISISMAYRFLVGPHDAPTMYRALTEHSNIPNSTIYRCARRRPRTLLSQPQPSPEAKPVAAKSLGRRPQNYCTLHPSLLVHLMVWQDWHRVIPRQCHAPFATRADPHVVGRMALQAVGCPPISSLPNPRIEDEAWHLDPRRPRILAINMFTSL
jgi:hypothetical protein